MTNNKAPATLGLLGDTVAHYEELGTSARLMPCLPALARLDGRGFSSFTRHGAKPFSDAFKEAMLAVTRTLAKETHACCAFTASDEITLAWYSAEPGSSIYFDGRVHKMVSSLAAEASCALQRWGAKHGTSKDGLAWHRNPTFDCRVWNVPTLEAAADSILWRQLDAGHNSVSMAARAYISHKDVLDKSSNERQEMLHSKFGINWNDYDPHFKRGTFIRKQRIERTFTAEEIEKLPPKHAARADPRLIVQRSEHVEEDLWLARISNRAQVLFHGAKPVTYAETAASM